MYEETELRKDAEQGRRARIAIDELKKFMTARREALTQRMENEEISPEEVRQVIAELRVLKRFQNIKKADIFYGEKAEEELRNGE